MSRKCEEATCLREAWPGWTRCKDHADRWLDRLMGITPPKPQPELPRWKPAA